MHFTDKMRTNHENSRKTMVQNNIEKFIVKSPSKDYTGIISFCDSFYSSEGIIYWSTQYASIKCPINIISLFLLY